MRLIFTDFYLRIYEFYGLDEFKRHLKMCLIRLIRKIRKSVDKNQ
jgi:hypothetical protein